MAPQAGTVQRLVTALFVVLGDMARARKNIPDAARLAVLQVIAAVERTEPDRGVRPSEIADRLDVHRSAVTPHVRALTQAGHISTRTDPVDRRSSLLFLTDSGRETVQQLAAQGMRRFSSFVADWSDDEVTALAGLLEKFSASAAAVNADTPPPSAPEWKSRTPLD
jgi:DNA-binding MarR family transcriptional regulator